MKPIRQDEMNEAVYYILGLPLAFREVIVKALHDRNEQDRERTARTIVDAAFRKAAEG